MPVQAPSAPSSISVGRMPSSWPRTGGSSTTARCPEPASTTNFTFCPAHRAVALCIAPLRVGLGAHGDLRRPPVGPAGVGARGPAVTEASVLRAGAVVLLHDPAGRRHPPRLVGGATFSTHAGAPA